MFKVGDKVRIVLPKSTFNDLSWIQLSKAHHGEVGIIESVSDGKYWDYAGNVYTLKEVILDTADEIDSIAYYYWCDDVLVLADALTPTIF